jgi:hypothetical protein
MKFVLFHLTAKTLVFLCVSFVLMKFFSFSVNCKHVGVFMHQFGCVYDKICSYLVNCKHVGVFMRQFGRSFRAQFDGARSEEDFSRYEKLHRGQTRDGGRK